MRSRELQAIRFTVARLVDRIDEARRAHPTGSFLERHPLVFALGTLGLELVGWRLLVKARRRAGTGDGGADVTWWNPPDSEGYVH